MNLPKRKVLMKAFITSQFTYCLLAWMLHSSRLNNRINNIHERALRLTYKNNQSSFREFLETNHSFEAHTSHTIQSNPIQSNPVQSSPIQSNAVHSIPFHSIPIQSNPMLKEHCYFVFNEVVKEQRNLSNRMITCIMLGSLRIRMTDFFEPRWRHLVSKVEPEDNRIILVPNKLKSKQKKYESAYGKMFRNWVGTGHPYVNLLLLELKIAYGI